MSSFDNTLDVFSAGTEPAEKINAKAVSAMSEVGIDISSALPKDIKLFLDQEWDYVITVCENANEKCPIFSGKVKHRLHFGFDDPASIAGNVEYVMDEFRRIRDEIKNKFFAFYDGEIKKIKEIPLCSCADK